MVPTVVAVLLTLTVAGSAAMAAAVPAEVSGLRTDAQLLSVSLRDLTAVRRLFNMPARDRESMDKAQRVAMAADLSLLIEAVAGSAQDHVLSFDDLLHSVTTPHALQLIATPGVSMRDRAAYQLLAIGYSARETADVVSGRITPRALDMASSMLAIGQGREAAANYLDAEYKRVFALNQLRDLPPPNLPGVWPTRFDLAIETYARLYNVDVALVRAVIGVESAFNPFAVSSVGAIGLMQLMPMTAHELGVNPWVPEQNIEGGVRYLASLLKTFGGVEMALVAYNGGPGFAQRYARGQTALYGETRDYVRQVLARLGSASYRLR